MDNTCMGGRRSAANVAAGAPDAVDSAATVSSDDGRAVGGGGGVAGAGLCQQEFRNE